MIKNVLETATQYAENADCELFKKVIAEAYAEGYKKGHIDGYHLKEREDLIEKEKHNTEYVDLGLPSGILWATQESSNFYSQYEARKFNLPTIKQWQELRWNCKFDYTVSQTYGVLRRKAFVGKNGNLIEFTNNGMLHSNDDRINNWHSFYFILADIDEKTGQNYIAKVTYDTRTRCTIFGEILWDTSLYGYSIDDMFHVVSVR